MVFSLNAACGSFIGTGRSNNEDNFYFHKKHLPVENNGLRTPLQYDGETRDPLVFAVFDGMGGESKGEEAARISSEIFSSEYKELEELVVPGKEFLCVCCEKANVAVNQYRRDKQLSAMGTTVAAIYFFQNEVIACNIGDSKIFRIRDKKMLQISEDHTDEKIMSAMGIQKKPVLLQYIGIPDTEMAIEPSISKGEIETGDIYILCSDGVTDVMDGKELYEIASRFEADEAVKQILAAVECKNGTDNATIIVIKIV